MSSKQEYIKQIKALQHPTFQRIKSIASESIFSLNKEEKTDIFNSLGRGVELLNSHEQLCLYLYSYGNMHEAKIKSALEHLQSNAYKGKSIQIIDWGCGQGLATICFLDYIREKGIDADISRVVLIEPSEAALERASIHVGAYLDAENIISHNKYLNDITSEDIVTNVDVTIHFFSNILDVESVNVKQLAQTVADAICGEHFFVCVGPLNANNQRIEAFFNWFQNPQLIWTERHNKEHHSYTACYKIFKIERFDTRAILVKYNPPKQFHAAYRLDCVRDIFSHDSFADRRQKVDSLYKYWSAFDVSTPFDIGASIYEDVNPVFAVLNNIIVRGLPTKASQLVENAFSTFGNTVLPDNLGGIKYSLSNISADDIFTALHAVDNRHIMTKETYNKGILESDLETHYICDVAPKLYQQILCPQRSLTSITNQPEHLFQKLDFTCQFPYGENLKGFIIELDENGHHNSKTTDKDNNQISGEEISDWKCLHLKETDISKNVFENLESEYIINSTKAYQKTYNEEWKKALQLTLSPIGIARVQKTIVEALLIGKLDIKAKNWDILVQERDVPCSALAIADLSQMFNHLTALSIYYDKMTFPQVRLTVISNPEFSSSTLHNIDGLDVTVIEEPNDIVKSHLYDLVMDVSVMRRSGIENISFSNFKSKNECYFNIRSTHYVSSNRQIYTSNVIEYKPLVTKESNGEYKDIEERKAHLEYFLRTLFRKQSFRSGQLPILSRALQNKCVIGLLPTGGGKSLTYQIAAMLQPGVTVVVDPLRSLMKDQYDGLLKTGIDTCTFINSTVNANEKEKRSKAMEDSLLQFIFLSPERLCIYGFREKLKNMHELGVYFSYGVIDEVHCVSEWGHDFRFTYLHLGRNLYNYVLPKQTSSRKHLTLFGLTATASFDVLADVERELSGNGQFPLDSDTIVRDENTNRLELQYKIEKVPVEYSEDKNFDPNHHLNGYPKPVNIKDKWAAHESKQKFLEQYVSCVPEYIRALQEKKAQDTIVNQFFARQNKERTEVPDLKISMPDDYASKKEVYSEAGIVFCPHKNGTGISVNENASMLKKSIPVGTFMGSSGGDSNESDKIDDESFNNLELFRDNKLPLMVATKAFGMGIDKPNVRFTVNMNYSSSLESFVQEAGRAGRDRHTALSVILLSDYKYVRVNPRCKISQFPMKIIKGKWFKEEDLDYILQKHNLFVDEKDKDIFSPERDMVKLKCEVCNIRFGFGLCNQTCSNCNKGPCKNKCILYDHCKLKDVPQTAKGFQYIKDLNDLLADKGLIIPKENLEYMNADYETVMYFFNNNFKGSLIEKRTMHELLSKSTIPLFVGNNAETKDQIEEVSDFLKRLLDSPVGTELVAFISTRPIGIFNNRHVYIIDSNKNNKTIEDINSGMTFTVPANSVEPYRDSADVDKAIYRMCCIGLIDDFTKDYGKNRCRVVAIRKHDGDYYKGLQGFLERYYSKEKAAEEIEKVPNYRGENEIHKCLGYLTEFIYDKIAVKRKRAIDDIRTFCMLGAEEGQDWLQKNEELKDFIYYYFNSKYARRDFVYEDLKEDDKSYSLTTDTNEGREFSMPIVYKYMRVIDDDITSLDSSSQIDNVKHLHGAVRLIRRSLTGSNFTIDFLNVFCLLFLGIGDNLNLKNEFLESYERGYRAYRDYLKDDLDGFYDSILNLKQSLLDRNIIGNIDQFNEIEVAVEAEIHSDWFINFTEQYCK